MAESPTTLTVILADTHRTYMAVTHENEWVPYGRRTVHIALTPEQRAALAPRLVGHSNGQERYEEIIAVFFEEADG